MVNLKIAVTLAFMTVTRGAVPRVAGDIGLLRLTATLRFPPPSLSLSLSPHSLPFISHPPLVHPWYSPTPQICTVLICFWESLSCSFPHRFFFFLLLCSHASFFIGFSAQARLNYMHTWLNCYYDYPIGWLFARTLAQLFIIFLYFSFVFLIYTWRRSLITYDKGFVPYNYMITIVLST